MTESLVLDLLLVLALIGYLSYGFRSGLSGTAFTIAGVVAGVIAAFFLAPMVATVVPYPFLRLAATVIVALGLVVAGHALGAAIGRSIRKGVERSHLGGADRLVGALVTGLVAAIVASVVSFSVAQLGVPILSKAISGSAVLRAINTFTPDPLESFLAEVRGALVDRSIPLITGALGTTPPAIPEIDTGSAALNAAAQSVVRITGNAFACGQSQSGTGFVISDDRIVTNAHVVAGVSEPVVEAPGGEVLTGSVVYFDPIDDLAVIAVPGLTAGPLARSTTLDAGADAAFEGYPHGGPFASGAANVVSVTMSRVADIYGTAETSREVYTLAADVREGNSGGPLLTLDGRVAGVVFARSADTANIGYAMTMTELDPVAAQADSLVESVSSGDCVRD